MTVPSNPARWMLPRQQGRSQRGLTLVELMVAMTLGTLVAIAAISALTMGRRGFATVDAAAQLRDNSRFAIDILQRLALQAGYRDVLAATMLSPGESVADGLLPGVGGFNNATPLASDAANKASSRKAGTTAYGSDVLVLRYQPSPTLGDSSALDDSMIDCAGTPMSGSAKPGAQIVSVLHVAIAADGEPALMCTVPSGAVSSATPLVKGVENFQVLYGVENVIPHSAPDPAIPRTYRVSRFLRADQLLISGDPAGTQANWRRVRSLRIGMVLRSSGGADRTGDAQTLFPLGSATAAVDGKGSTFSTADDPGTEFTPGSDGRLRQAVTFTVQLRNEQDL